MAIDLTAISAINEQLKDKYREGENIAPSLCLYIQRQGVCMNVECDTCPFNFGRKDLGKIQKKIDMLNLVLPGD